MKKHYVLRKMSCLAFLLVLLIGTTGAFAQGHIELNSVKSAQHCANVTDEGFTASFSFSSIDATEISAEKGVFSNITMENTYPSGNVGEPSLPAVNKLLAVPCGVSAISVEVKNYTVSVYTLADYGIKTLYPQQPLLRKDQNPSDLPFAYSEKAYNARGFAERPIAEVQIQGTLRGIQVAALTVNPVQYDPTNNSIRVYNNIEVEVRYGQYDKSASYNEFARTFSPYFANIYSQMFNWRDDVYTQHPDLWNNPVHMLVIANRMFESSIQEWLAWKTTKGFYVDVNYTDDIGSTSSAIRTFIQNKYAQNAPTFLMIMGDKAQIPASATGSETSCVTDLSYSSVDGDQFPDMYHSRFPAETVAQMQAMLNKALEYEQYTMPDPSYLNNVLLIAGEDSGWGVTVGRPTIWYATNYYYNQAHGFSNVYEYSHGTYTGCYTHLNTGVGFVNYTAHGSNTSWAGPSFTVSDVNNLTNTHKYFLAMGNCCEAADWGISGTCFGEAMVRAENKAAYAYIGSCPSTYWMNDYYFGVGATSRADGTMPSYEETTMGAYDAIWTDDAYNTVTSILFIGNLAGNAAQALGYTLHCSTLYNWQAYHVLGDGSVLPFRVQPTANTVSHMAVFPLGMSTFEVNAVPGSYVAVSKDGVLHGTGVVPESGTLQLEINPITTGGDVTLCVTHPRHIPYVSTIPAAALEGPFLIVDSYTPTEAHVGESSTLSISFKNVGTVATNGTTTVTLSSNDANLTIHNGTASFGSLDPEAMVMLNGFSYSIAQNVADGTSFTIHITSSCGSDTWEGSVTITAGAAKLEFDEMSWGGSFVPGGTVPVVARFRNTGHYQASNAVMSVSTASGYASIANPTVNVGTVAPGGYAMGTFSVSIAGDCPQSAQIPLSFGLTADGGLSAEGVGVLKNSCNVVFELADSYGDGWNGNVLNVAFSDGSPAQSLTMSQGSSATYTLEIGNGVHVTLSWTLGSWTNECSFVMSYEGGDVIYQASNPSSGVLYQFDCNCAGDVTWYDIAATACPAGAGTVAGTGSYMEGETCTLTAAANSGYAFVNWTENGTQVSTDPTYTFTVTGNRSLVANFEEVAAGYHWDVNIHTYPNTLIMVGVVLINGVEQATDMLEVGTFCNGECRGRERLSGQYYQIFGRYFVNLTVYGEDGDEISFRLYDHATETELDLTCAPITFTTNGVFGNPVNPHVLDFGPSAITQTTDFAEGWNWWSTYIDQTGIDGLTMLEEGLGDNGITVKSQGDGFVQYMNYGGYTFWYGTLDHLVNSQTYMVQTDAAVQAEMTGAPVSPADSPITISEGWNWIGFPSANAMDFNTAFSGITPSNNDIVKTQNSFAQYMVYGSYSFWYGELSNSVITPGTGLMYKSENPDSFTFTYPVNGRVTTGTENEVTQRDGHWESDVHAYPNNMTVVAVIEYNGEELRSEHYELGVFAGSECRGSVKLSYMEPLDRYMAFLTISGEDAVTLNFGLYDETTGDENFDSDASLVFTANATIGNAVEPYVIGFRGTTGLSEMANCVQVYPNPVEAGGSVSVLTEGAAQQLVQVEIMNILGSVIDRQTVTKTPASIAAPKVPGIYMIRFTVEGGGVTLRKLVVE